MLGQPHVVEAKSFGGADLLDLLVDADRVLLGLGDSASVSQPNFIAVILICAPHTAEDAARIKRGRDTRGLLDDSRGMMRIRDHPRERTMSLMSFLSKQFVDVLQWNEDGPGVLAWRYPMLDREIRNGAALTVRDTQNALFVNEARSPICLARDCIS